MSYDDFDATFSLRAGKSVLKAVSESAGSDVDAVALRSAVADALAAGSFRLVVAVDQITPELRSSVEYLNEHLSDAVPFMALELGYLKSDGVEVLVQNTYGAELESAERHKRTTSPRRWTAEEVDDAVAELEDEVQRSLIQQLLAHAEKHQAVCKGGTAASPSAGYYYLVAGKRCSVWSLYVKPQRPTIAINLGSVAHASPELADQMAAARRSATVFSQVIGAQPGAAAGKYPGSASSISYRIPPCLQSC